MTTALYGIEELVEGSGQQAIPVNTAIGILEGGLAGRYTTNGLQTGNVTLTSAQFKNRFFEFTGSLSADTRVVDVPAVSRFFVVYNNTTGSHTFTVKTAAGTGQVIDNGARVLLECDGVNVNALGTVSSVAATTEAAQDAVGAMVDATLVYNDSTPSLGRAAITGHVAIASGSNSSAIQAGVVTEAMQVLADNTTQDVSTTKHGYAPKAPNNAAQFLDGTGAWDTVKDADLSTSDITTNDVSTTKHGFVPKAPNDASQVLNGVGAWATPSVGQGKHTIWIPAGGMTPSVTSGAVANTIEMSTNKNTHRTLTFGNTGAKVYAEFDVAFPKKWNKSTVTFQAFWTVNGTATDGVVFGLQAVAISNNDALDVAFGTAQEVTDNGLGTSAYKEHVTSESSAITIAGTPADDDVVNFRFYRDSANGSDTLAASIELLGIKVAYTTNANTDA